MQLALSAKQEEHRNTLGINDIEGDIVMVDTAGIMVEEINSSLITHLRMNMLINSSLTKHPHITIMRTGKHSRDQWWSIMLPV